MKLCVKLLCISLIFSSCLKSLDLRKQWKVFFNPYVASLSGTSLYEKRSVKSKKIILIPFNAKIKILNRDAYWENYSRNSGKIKNFWVNIRYKKYTGWVYNIKTSLVICNLYSGLYFYKSHPIYIRLELIGTNKFWMQSTIIYNNNQKNYDEEFCYDYNTNANQYPGSYKINGSTLILNPSINSKEIYYFLIISTNKLQYISKNDKSLKIRTGMIFQRK